MGAKARRLVLKTFGDFVAYLDEYGKKYGVKAMWKKQRAMLLERHNYDIGPLTQEAIEAWNRREASSE